MNVATIFGPFDLPGAIEDVEVALGQGAAVLGLSAVLLATARRRPELAGVLALALVTVDLGLANASIVRTVPQSDLEKVPKVVREIARAEELDPSPGPYRVHRMPIWSPNLWRMTASEDRIRDFVRWELDTIQPKYGILHGINYTYTLGTAELYDYEWFFSPFPRAVRGAVAKGIGVKDGDPVVVYPRRGFDLWNTRYFILPAYPRWEDPDRGIASFLPETERIYPPPGAFNGPDGEARRREWIEREDVQIFRNKAAMPRAWTVHGAIFKPVVAGLTRLGRREAMEEIVYGNDPFWSDPDRTARDPRQLAWIEMAPADRPSLNDYLTPGAPSKEADSVEVVESTPQRVVLKANLGRPGLVILADVFYPGWKLTVDGETSTILRANRLMRGAAVRSGSHTLVYTYEPRSFRVGGIVSLGSLVALGGFFVWTWRKPHKPAD